MLCNKKTKRNLAILLMATVVVGLTMTAWAKKPDKPPGGGGEVGTGTIYYSSDGYYRSMNPDGTGKTPLLAWADYDLGAASMARHPVEGDRWFLQVSEVDGFYPITTFPPLYAGVLGLDDLEAVGFTGDPDPDGAWGTIHYYIEIDGEGETDTFRWYGGGVAPPGETGVAITGGEQLLIDGSTGLTIKFGSRTGHTLGSLWWIRVVKTQRHELFAVSEDGQSEVQLTDDLNVQPWSPGYPSRALPSWATRDGVVDGKVSYLAQRWGKDADEDVVVERGLFAVEIAWDGDGTPYDTTAPTVLPVSVPLEIDVWISYDWSPDGTQIVYSADGGIWVADADAEDPGDLLLCEGCEGSGPRWSPVLADGSTLIAFRAGSWGEAAEIRTISPGADSATTVVAVGKNRNIRGDLIHWSPMGTHLVYTVIHSKACAGCQYNDSYDVYRVGADGSDATNLTKRLQEDAFSVGWRD